MTSLKRAYYLGVAAWSRWLPVVGTGLFLAILALNLAQPHAFRALTLTSTFSTLELVVLFLVGPLFLTRIGGVLATATVLYCIERLLLGNADASPTIGLQLVCAAATFAAVLGDRIPWLAGTPSAVAPKLREILLVVVTIACLAIVFTALIKVHGFHRWFTGFIGLDLPAPVAMVGLVLLFLGWLSVALGFTRPFAITLLTLPTLFALAYVTACPASWLVIPFALTLALSLATAERRTMLRRRQTGYQPAIAA